MPDFGIFRGFGSKLFSDKLYAGQLPTQLGLIGSESFGYLYLLDDYPNAAAAYSLRKLRSAYTGSAIRVRRSSDNTEQDIGFVDNVLDTASLASFCSGTNGFVKTWYDQSGNGRYASQTTAANQPQIVASGSVLLSNSNPSLRFNSSKYYINFTLNNPISSFIVAEKDDNAIDYFIDGIFSNNSHSLVTLNSTDVRLRNTNMVNLVHTMTNYTWTDQNLIYEVTNGDNSLVGVNDSYTTGTTGTNTVTTGGITIGTGALSDTNILTGNISELIVYNSDETTNISGIRTNINSFYSIY